jgi:hypothetical protein
MDANCCHFIDREDFNDILVTGVRFVGSVFEGRV